MGAQSHALGLWHDAADDAYWMCALQNNKHFLYQYGFNMTIGTFNLIDKIGIIVNFA